MKLLVAQDMDIGEEYKEIFPFKELVEWVWGNNRKRLIFKASNM